MNGDEHDVNGTPPAAPGGRSGRTRALVLAGAGLALLAVVTLVLALVVRRDAEPEKTRAEQVFEACQAKSPSPTATLSEDKHSIGYHVFKWDPDAEKAFTFCVEDEAGMPVDDALFPDVQAPGDSGVETWPGWEFRLDYVSEIMMVFTLAEK